MVLQNRLSSFTAARLNSSTFIIVEDDSYDERPLIYAKIYTNPPVLVLTDTGTASPSKRSKNAKYTHLKAFLETCPVPSNSNRPLNPAGHLTYILIITHCHYDHIGAAAPFASSGTTIASAAGRAFITTNLWEHSLCKDLGLPPPLYAPDLFAPDGSRLFFTASGLVKARSDDGDVGEGDLGIKILTTPGHTPDELAWYDERERWLYVGDSVYTVLAPGLTMAQAVIFPSEGDLVTFLCSMEGLLEFVRAENRNGEGKRGVRIACGHVNCDEDAEWMLSSALRFVGDVVDGSIPVSERTVRRGEENLLFWSEDKVFALRLPSRLLEDARRKSTLERPCIQKE